MRAKKLFILLVALSLMLTIVACGSNQQNASTSSGKDTPDTTNSSTSKEENPPKEEVKPIEMVWAGWSGEEESSKAVFKEMIDAWNQKEPSATVKWVGWPWGNTLEQLIIRTQGNESLDVAQVDMGWLQTLAEMDVLEDLNVLIGEDWLKSNIEEATLAAGRVDGKQVAVPWTAASIGMVYNPTLLEQAGVTQPPATIAEFEETLKKLKESSPDVIPYAMSTKDAGSVGKDFLAWLWTFGGQAFDGDKVTINSPAGVETLTWMKKLLDNGYVSMDMSRFDARQMYATKKVGFYDDAIFAKGILKSNGVEESELDQYIRPILRPVVNQGETPQSALWGHQLVVFKSAKDKQKAAEFIKHLLSDDQALTYFKAVGLPPVKKSAIANEVVQSDVWMKEWLEITATGQKAETQLFTNTGELDTIITEEVQAALLGTKTPQKALDDAAARLQSSLK